MTAPTTGRDGRLGLTMTLHTSTPVVQDPRLVELGINVVRGLAMDAPQEADSGHSGTAMALAPLAHVLWTRVMHYDPRDPGWPDRDRFVLSCGHACILQYAMLHLTGYDLSLEDLRQFRQWGSKTPGHPEVHHTPGIEVTTGPLGQGFANAVGMALAERIVRTRFGREVCDHRTYVFASDGCMMEGISHEAASLAGHLGLGRLLAVYDDNHITIDGPTELTYDDDGRALRGLRLAGAPPRRDGERRRRARRCDRGGARAATRRPRRQAHPARPAQPHRLALPAPHGHRQGPRHPLRRGGDPRHQGDPGPAARRDVLGARRGPHLLRAADRAQRARARRGTARFESWDGDRAGWDAAQAGHGSPGWDADLPRFESGTMLATRRAVNQCIDATVGSIPGLVAGSADLTGNNGVLVKGAEIQARTSPGGTQVHYGIREHGMGGVMNGMAAHRGVLPVGGTFFVFSDYMRPAVRLAALGGAHVIYSWTHDSIGLGEDGPTHQPIEHLASLRAMPGLSLVRPADANETAQAWRLAVEADGPVGLALTRQNVPVLARRPTGPPLARARRLRPGRSGGHPRHRARGARGARSSTAWPPRPRWPVPACGRGWCRSRAGTASSNRTRATGRASSRRGCRCSASRRARPWVGPLRRRRHRDRPLRGVRPGGGRHGEVRLHARARGGTGPRPVAATVADAADRRRELSR